MVHMRPTAIVLNYSIENIWNDVRQKIIIYEKFQFDSLVWGSFMLAPNTTKNTKLCRVTDLKNLACP